MTKSTMKIIDPIDKYVGGRVRMRRMQLGVSQEKLADALDLTFQQVQKYEKGTNRIAPSRMVVIAQRLGVPVEFFFAGCPGMKDAPSIAPDIAADLFTSRDGVAMATAFAKIRKPKSRRAAVAMLQAMAG